MLGYTVELWPLDLLGSLIRMMKNGTMNHFFFQNKFKKCLIVLKHLDLTPDYLGQAGVAWPGSTALRCSHRSTAPRGWPPLRTPIGSLGGKAGHVLKRHVKGLFDICCSYNTL